MAGENGQFRTGLFGFRRRDVLTYLETANRQENGQLEDTRSRLEEAQQELTRLRTELMRAQQAREQAEADTRTLQAAIDEYVQTASQRSAEQEELLLLRREKQMWRVKESSLMRSAADTAALQQELTELQQELTELRQQAAEQESVAVLQQRLEQTQRDAVRYRELAGALSRFVGTLRAQYADADGELAALMQQLDTAGDNES